MIRATEARWAVCPTPRPVAPITKSSPKLIGTPDAGVGVPIFPTLKVHPPTAYRRILYLLPCTPNERNEFAFTRHSALTPSELRSRIRGLSSAVYVCR